MPTYQYHCKSCSTDLEVVQKFTDASLTECPECRGELRKVYGAVGVVFKGSGFYKTDNRTKDSSGGGSAAPSAPTADSSATTGNSSSSEKSGTTAAAPAAAASASSSSAASTPAAG
ncbi:FmdB family zinc ribbon protein [Propionibacteriaceae bacterium G1746]|uniref:FmdB family zinc ribbon protein n=1 Tax=Aestuariimicrobium sp. G57 TaxID=3418485 RepID=UPI003C2640E1